MTDAVMLFAFILLNMYSSPLYFAVLLRGGKC